MKKAFKIIIFIWIGLFIILLLSATCLLITASIDKTSFLNDKEYNSIETLHEDYKKACYEETDITCYPNELVFYESYGDAVFVFCTYTYSHTQEDEEDALYIYAIKRVNDAYVFEVPYLGIQAAPIAYLPLHTDYNHWTYNDYYMECNIYGIKQSIGFVYKEKGSKALYFDGIKMDEAIHINPFTKEEFVLCSATSSKTYSVLQSIFVRKEERHSLEVK